MHRSRNELGRSSGSLHKSTPKDQMTDHVPDQVKDKVKDQAKDQVTDQAKDQVKDSSTDHVTDPSTDHVTFDLTEREEGEYSETNRLLDSDKRSDSSLV